MGSDAERREDDEMSGPDEVKARAIRRILVALDASAPSMAALDAAVHLAARLRAEITGVFVEDKSLLEISELSITREVGGLSGVARDFDRKDMERHLRAQSAQAERMLAHAAERAHVVWSFRVLRGAVTHELLAASSQVDLVTVGCQGSRLTGWRDVGSTANAVLRGTACPVLVIREGARFGPPVYAVFDGTPSSQTVLSIAAEVARAMDDIVVVITADDGSGDAEDLADAAETQLLEAGVEARFRRFRTARPVTIAALTQEHAGGVLVLPSDSPWLTAQALRELTREVRCPVLLARGELREDEVGISDGEAEAAASDDCAPQAETAAPDEPVF